MIQLEDESEVGWEPGAPNLAHGYNVASHPSSSKFLLSFSIPTS